MKQKTIKFILLSLFIVLLLSLCLVYLKSINLEQFSSINKEKLNNITMTHNTVLEPDDISDPTLNENDIINQTNKYKATIDGSFIVDYSSTYTPTPSFNTFSPNQYTPEEIVNTINFPTIVKIDYSNYKNLDKKDPFENKIIIINSYNEKYNAYTLLDQNKNTIMLSGKDGSYPLWALNTSYDTITCGWNDIASDDYPNNNYPNKLVLTVKSILSSLPSSNEFTNTPYAYSPSNNFANTPYAYSSSNNFENTPYNYSSNDFANTSNIYFPSQLIQNTSSNNITNSNTNDDDDDNDDDNDDDKNKKNKNKKNKSKKNKSKKNKNKKNKNKKH